jgi:hypothetical protein
MSKTNYRKLFPMQITNTSDPQMYTVPAWKLFKECQIIADDIGYGGIGRGLHQQETKESFANL